MWPWNLCVKHQLNNNNKTKQNKKKESKKKVWYSEIALFQDWNYCSAAKFKNKTSSRLEELPGSQAIARSYGLAESGSWLFLRRPRRPGVLQLWGAWHWSCLCTAQDIGKWGLLFLKQQCHKDLQCLILGKMAQLEISRRIGQLNPRRILPPGAKEGNKRWLFPLYALKKNPNGYLTDSDIWNKLILLLGLYTQIYKMSVFPEDRELSWILVDYLKNNGERKGHQCTDNTSKSVFSRRHMLLMNHRLHSFTLPSGLSSGAGLYLGESTGGSTDGLDRGVQTDGCSISRWYLPPSSWSLAHPFLAKLAEHPWLSWAGGTLLLWGSFGCHSGTCFRLAGQLACVTPQGMFRSHFQALACKQQFQEHFSF